MKSPEAYARYLTHRSRLSLSFRTAFTEDLKRHFPGQVLDIGCGAGEFLEAYPGAVGIEFNPFLAGYCRRLGMAVTQADIFQLPFLSGHFEGVLISNVLEHLGEPALAFGEAVRVTKTGGKIVTTVPYQAGFHRDPTHLKYIAWSDLHAFAARYHLNQVKVYGFPHGSDLFGRWITFCELRAVFIK